MFTHSSPSPPTLATTTSPASPTLPLPRTGRLRGLSYLRNYTHSHIHTHSGQTTGNNTRSAHLSRSTSYPNQAPPEPRQPKRSTTDHTRAEQNIASGSTNGWPPVGSRVANQPQQVAVQDNSASEARLAPPAPDSIETSMGRNRVSSASQAPERAIPFPGPFLSSGALEFARLDGSTTMNTALTGPPDTSASAIAAVEQPATRNPPPQRGSLLGAANSSSSQLPSIRFIPYQDPRSPRPPLAFTPVSRTLPDETSVLKVGRYSERDSNPNPAPSTPSAAPIGFKSKVVSRRHCEFWYSNGRWYIKDAKSSSGTFLNHIRLSQPGLESRPFPVNDGDVVQLGIDFRGGEEMIFRCVKIRVELNRGWQKELNYFNVNTHKRLRNLTKSTASRKDEDNTSMHTSECSICLMSIAPCQSLFVAPCSHVWHYKCIRPILSGPTWPHFLCPNCRAVTDLEADVEDPSAYEGWEEEIDESEELKEETEKAPNQVDDAPARSGSGSGSAHRSRAVSYQDDGEEESTRQEGLATIMGALTFAGEDPASHEPMSSPGGIIVESPTLPEWQATDGLLSRRVGSSARPLNIDSTRPNTSQIENTEDNSGQPTPESGARASLGAENVVTEGPMTPRNDAGPFVFDGSAGRAAGRRIENNLGLNDTSARRIADEHSQDS